MVVKNRLFRYNTASYNLTSKNCSLSLISSYRAIKLKLLKTLDNCICTKDTVQLRPKSAPMKKCTDKILDFEYVIVFLSTFKN